MIWPYAGGTVISMRNERRKKTFAKRSLGQNFLIDRTIVERIVNAVGPTKDDIILEIGPGHGALTERLVERARTVYALEFDRDLAPLLKTRFESEPNFILIEDDALSFDFQNLKTGEQKLRLVANLPYNISTAILQRLFDLTDILADCVLMFQREVVDRITAAPGTRDRGYLTVLTEAHFDVERLFDVPPTAFRPAPKIWSAVVKLVAKQLELENEEHFRTLVGTAFAQKRKTILNNLKEKYPGARTMLESAGVEADRRAETLSLDEWLRLARQTDSGA